MKYRFNHVAISLLGALIMNLLLLAPDIHEVLLTLPRKLKGRDPIRKRHVRPIAAEPDWHVQRAMWGGGSVRHAR